jgi:hypothetical protein
MMRARFLIVLECCHAVLMPELGDRGQTPDGKRLPR